MTSKWYISRFSLLFLLLIAPPALAQDYQFPFKGEDTGSRRENLYR